MNYKVEIFCVDCETYLTHCGNKQEIQEFLDANDHEGATVAMTCVIGGNICKWYNEEVYEELKKESELKDE